MPETQDNRSQTVLSHGQNRVRTVQKRLAEINADALLIVSRENTRYYSHFAGTESFLLIGREQAWILTDFRYLEQVGRQSPHVQLIDNTIDRESALQPLFEQEKVKRLAIEADDLTYRLSQQLLSMRPGMELVSFDSQLADIRSVKDEEELRLMQQATDIAEAALADVMALIRAGTTEVRIAAALEQGMRERGAEGPSFATIVASGPRSALPHGLASDRCLAEGDAVVIDFGCQYQGYMSDMTRTFFVGSVSEHDRMIYDLVLKAHLEALAAVRAGKTGAELDQVARGMIEAAGYGPQFGHGLGHGVGLAIHEAPRLSRTWQQPLAAGQIVTVEPGIYLSGRMGVRIEDMAVVLPDGCRSFNRFDKNLLVLG
ncbi:MAG: Xaa-Pro peptidase family protein [Eubacteriales bacterium]|nr:Xaa-Pro peptidase family protein [Eubacteriales bacterium]